MMDNTSARPTHMTTRLPEEKIRPFRLVKYFTFTGLVVIFLVTIILAILNTHWVKSMQRKKSEDYAHALIENLNHQVFIQFILPIGMKFGKVQLRNQEQFERMDNVVRSTLHSFKVDELNIYSMNNTISYSFDEGRIGVKAVGGTPLEEAKSGRSTSKLVQRGSFLEILMGFPKDVRLVTFAPLRWEEPLGRITDPVLGVVEVAQNLSEDYQTIFRIQILVVITCTVLMCALFVVLIFVVKRGEAIIERRAEERIRLKEQLSRAERLSAMGEMAAGISHEVRNPLGIIRSSAELLKKKVAKIDSSNPLPDIIVEEASRLNNIITDFINFARPRSPKLSPCRIEDILNKNITFLSAQIAEGGYTIEKNYKEPLPEIMADAPMLHQSFLNLFINAMQAMPGGGRIGLAIRAEGGWVIVDIEDDGKGIPVGLLDKIWDPFFTTKDKGTGLGLGIVKNIIQSHGGGIRIGNRAPQGVSVTVELPVSPSESQA
jgi:two-component system, NtrC family, sensor histidine kinase HydH